MIKKIVIKGAKEHNLKNISLEIPKDKFVVITGLSGSGKSSLAFDTVYAEGQRRYVESLSAYARQFLDKMKKPNVDLIEGLSPAISIEQKNTSKNPRSTVATVTEIYDYMRVLYARAGIPFSPFTGKPITSQTVTQIVDKIKELPKKSTIYIYAPVVRGRKGEYRKEILNYKKRGFRKINETLSRTLITSITTLLALLSIFFFGGEILRGFSLAMIFGVIFGTYSSIYIANTVLVRLRVSQKTVLKEDSNN